MPAGHEPFYQLINELRERAARGEMVYASVREHLVTSSERALGVGEISLDHMQGATEPALLAYIYCKEPLPPRNLLLQWYANTRARNRAVTLRYSKSQLAEALARRRLAYRRLARASFKTPEALLLEYRADIGDFVDDRGEKDPDPFTYYLLLMPPAGLAEVREKVEPVTRELARRLQMEAPVRHGEAVPGVWVKPARRAVRAALWRRDRDFYDIQGLLRDFLTGVEVLEGENVAMEYKNLPPSQIPSEVEIGGMKLETADDYYDGYRIWLEPRALRIYASLHDRSFLDTALSLLEHYGIVPLAAPSAS